MKTKYLFLATLAAATSSAVLTSCTDDYMYDSVGEGKVSLKASLSSDVKIVSRSDQQSLIDQYGESLIVWISVDDENSAPIRTYNGYSSLPTEPISLTADSYVAEAWAGDSVRADWEKKYFRSASHFDVTKGGNVEVDLNLKIMNTVVSITWDETVAEVLTDYSMTVAHELCGASLEYTSEMTVDNKGYFMMSSYDTNLLLTLTGTDFAGNSYQQTMLIEDAQPTTEYQVTVASKAGPDSVGGVYFEITVDTTEILTEETIEFTVAPSMYIYYNGEYYDLPTTIKAQPSSFDDDLLAYFTAAEELTAVRISGDEIKRITNLSALNLLETSDSYAEMLYAAGIYFAAYKKDDNNPDNVTNMLLQFDDTYLNALSMGEYEFTIEAEGNGGKTVTSSFSIEITNASLETNAINDILVYTSKATISGTMLDSTAENCGFEYRQSGASAWTFVNADIEDAALSATLTGLTPGTTYEYRAVCDDFNASVEKFTTEYELQLPNAGFEEWQTSSSPYLIYASDGEMFWDSGNHGSATMSKNVTIPSSDVKHSGNYSVCLNSQFVGIASIGKFAAGNVFCGKYLATSGTDGILGWGREFKSRPKSLKGYVKYEPATVTYESSSYDAIKKGDMDQGIIYWAILDETLQSYDGEYWPVVIKTKSSERQLFSKTDSNVIAYGEMIFTEATSGDDMVEFEVPLEYYRTDKACYILITCAASRGGDYFVGGPSMMYLDDLEIIYE